MRRMKKMDELIKTTQQQVFSNLQRATKNGVLKKEKIRALSDG